MVLEAQQDSRFIFVPFSKQPDLKKIHRIRLNVDFPASSLGQEELADIAHLRTTHIEHIFGWGDIDRIECIVPDTPALEQDGQVFLEDSVLSAIKVKGQAILHCIESERPEDLEALAVFLPSGDILKVDDFIHHRRRPVGYSPK